MSFNKSPQRGNPRPLRLPRILVSLLLIDCMDIRGFRNRGSSLVVHGQIISIEPNTPMPSASPTWLNSVRVPPATPSPAAMGPIAAPVESPSGTTPPMLPPSETPTIAGTQDTAAPSAAPILNIVQTVSPSELPTFMSATDAPAQVVSRSNNDSTLLVAVLIPVASVSALFLLILLGRRRRRDPYLTKDRRWNASLTENDPPLLGATSNNQSAFDDSSLYTKSSNPGGAGSSIGFHGGSTNSAAGWIASRNEHPSITEEPTEETDAEDEDEPNQRNMERMEEGSSLYYYSNDTDTETSDSFLSGNTNETQKTEPDDEAVTATTEISSRSSSKVVGILKNAKESISKDMDSHVEVAHVNDGDGENGNVEVALTNYCGEKHEGIQYDDIVGIDSNSNISGEVSRVHDRESLYISSDNSSTGFTTVSDPKPQPSVVPIAAANIRSTGIHPLSFLKRKSRKSEETPGTLSKYITSEDFKRETNDAEHLVMDYSISAESADTREMPMSTILNEFNHHDSNTDNSSTIEPFSELTAEYGDNRSVGSDDAIVDASEEQFSGCAHPVEPSSCDSSAVNVFETDNESNASSRSATSPVRLFKHDNVYWGVDSKIADPLSRGEDRKINNFEQLYESISSEWEWKEPSTVSMSDAPTPSSSYPDALTLETKRPDPGDTADSSRMYSYGGRDHI